eukprot:scaffold131152_cov36-Tisochrysis_lutea.AAC.2
MLCHALKPHHPKREHDTAKETNRRVLRGSPLLRVCRLKLYARLVPVRTKANARDLRRCASHVSLDGTGSWAH